jgi:hypothetical protein
MFQLPPPTTVHWVYDDPSGVDQRLAAIPMPRPKPKRGHVLHFPIRRPQAAPKAA